MGGKKNSDITN